MNFLFLLNCKSHNVLSIVRFFSLSTLTLLSTSTTASNILTQLYSKLEDFEDLQEIINKEIKLYNMQETFHKELKQIRQVLDTMTKVWKIVEEWENIRYKYETANFWNINVEELEDTVFMLFKNINKMYEVHREKTNWEFLVVNRMRVEDFKKTLPLISDLKNIALKERHWNQVRSFAQKYLMNVNRF